MYTLVYKKHVSYINISKKIKINFSVENLLLNAKQFLSCQIN